MESIDGLTRILELGISGILTAVLWTLWHEFKEQNKFIRETLIQGSAERKLLSRAMGIDTITLKEESDRIRAEMAAELERREKVA